MLRGFTVRNWKIPLPEEDSYAFDGSEGAGVVADGITRDPRGMAKLPDTMNPLRNPIGAAKYLSRYPRPSPAKKASETFCSVFLDSMRQFDEKDERAMRESFREGNGALLELNLKENPEPDYLENDFWACVAAGMAIQDDVLSYGFIADCGVCVFDENGAIVFQTPNEGPNSKGSIDKDVEERYDTSFAEPRGRKIIRSQYRNNPAEPLAFGALSGEGMAMCYVRTGQIELSQGNSVVVYSDGLEDVIVSDEFAAGVREKDLKGIEKLCRRGVRTEGTLVYAC